MPPKVDPVYVEVLAQSRDRCCPHANVESVAVSEEQGRTVAAEVVKHSVFVVVADEKVLQHGVVGYAVAFRTRAAMASPRSRWDDLVFVGTVRSFGTV